MELKTMANLRSFISRRNLAKLFEKPMRFKRKNVTVSLFILLIVVAGYFLFTYEFPILKIDSTQVIAYASLLIALGAAGVTIKQASEASRSRKLAFVLEAYKVYSTTDMRDAIRTMWRDSKNIKEFISGQEVYNDSKDEDRRRVSDFWNMIGWAVKAKLIEADLIQLRFQEGPMIWQRLYPIELQIQLNSKNYEKLSEQERNEKAQHHAENLLGHWLYTEWKRKYKYDGPKLNYDYYLLRLAEADNMKGGPQA